MINLKAIEERNRRAAADEICGDCTKLVAWVGRARTLLRHYSRWCSRGYCVRGNECSLCRENLKLQEELRDE